MPEISKPSQNTMRCQYTADIFTHCDMLNNKGRKGKIKLSKKMIKLPSVSEAVHSPLPDVKPCSPAHGCKPTK